jgi:hypothetical protein
VVKASGAPVDVKIVSRHRAATTTDRAPVTIPQPRAAEEVPSTDALLVREWRRLGRRCLFVETADARIVGFLNVNTGAVTLTNEAERPAFEAAVVAWFAGALDVEPPPAVEPTTSRHRAAGPADEQARTGGSGGGRHRSQ